LGALEKIYRDLKNEKKDYGIELDEQSRIQNVIATENNGAGIRVGDRSTVISSSALPP